MKEKRCTMKHLTMIFDSLNNKYIVECEALGRINLKSSIGSKCLYQLINNEGRSFYPTILRNMISNNDDISRNEVNTLHTTDKEERYLYLALNTYIPAVDRIAVVEIITRINRITQELLEAEQNNDLKMKEDLIAEKEFCQDYLAKAINKNGTIKNLNDNNRKATKSIQRGLDELLQEVLAQSPAFFEILESRIVKSSSQVKYVDYEN